MSYSKIVLWIFIALSIVSPSYAQITTYWRLSENQLDVKDGGRVNSVAVSTFDPHVMLAASETGGLFKTNSAGAHWFHIDGLPAIYTQSVIFLPSDPLSQTILVSAKADFRSPNGGGVWRSTNGGGTWTQTLMNTPGQERMSAYEISVKPGTNTVVVGTSYGYALSFDGGQSWSPFSVWTFGDKNVYSVLATNNRTFLGGPSGTRTLNAGLFLEPLSNSPGSIPEMHAFAQRGSTNHIFAINHLRRLFVSIDGGNSWTVIAHAPQGLARCAGIPFIKVADHSATVDLFLSDRCGLHTLSAPIAQGFPNYFVDNWQHSDVDRGRPRDLALSGTTPLLLGTTAGVHNNATAPNVWRLVGGGREGGFNALQINEVKGQLVAGQMRPDLYAGTRESGMLAAAVNGDIVKSHSTDGHYIELDRDITSGETPLITFNANNLNEQGDRNLLHTAAWPDPTGHRGAPALLAPCRYVENTTRTVTVRQPGMFITDDCGQTWDRFAYFREQTTDIPKPGIVMPSVMMVYQSYKDLFHGIDRLLRVVQSSTAPTDVQYPEMNLTGGGTVGLGVVPTGFGGYQAYTVNPVSTNHLVAPDVVSGQMVETRDGGRNWAVMDDLTAKVKNGYIFNTGKFPNVTTVSFYPRFFPMMLAGTAQGGIYASSDSGVSWLKIADSERATYVTSFFWHNANTVYLSTYGRGLWKLSVRAVAPADNFNQLCSTCDVQATEKFAASALVFDGQMLGVRTEKGLLREVFVTPGSSVVFTGDPKDPQDDIAITETDGRDPSQYEPLPQPKEGIVTGVVLASDDTLLGTASAMSQMTLLPPAPKEIDTKGSTDSPTKGNPYITLTTSGSAAVPTVEPEETFDLSASDFYAGMSYELLVDGTPLKGSVTADSTGCFDTTITAPSDAGYHSVTVRLAGDEKAIEGSTFFVRTEN